MALVKTVRVGEGRGFFLRKGQSPHEDPMHQSARGCTLARSRFMSPLVATVRPSHGKPSGFRFIELATSRGLLSGFCDGFSIGGIWRLGHRCTGEAFFIKISTCMIWQRALYPPSPTRNAALVFQTIDDNPPA